ncbi:MAG TPA: metallophosphoesterase family protein [Candidatus Thermoplasmatota archaeon]|nr:metallophosphoesterase family protein [Candidatus Thermoplasmatota archaeon]
MAPRMPPLAPLLCLLLLVGGVAAQAPIGPNQVHLSVVEDSSTSITVTWWLPVPDDGTDLVVDRGLEEPLRVPGVLQTGPVPGAWYAATATGLVAGERYSYTVEGNGQVAGPFTFQTAGNATVVRFAAVGDMGITADSRRSVETLLALDPAFVLHPGDISYAEGDEQVWQAWFGMVEPLAATRPYMAAIGNHETYTAAPVGAHLVTREETPHTPETRSYLTRFSLPGNELWYSFDWGGVHVVALDTFASDFSEGSPQWAWLEQDLAAAQGATWRIAFLHEPLYSTNAHGSSLDVRAAFEPLFDRYGVDLVIQAHDHGYERSHGMRGGAVVAQGPDYVKGEGTVYVTTGGGGQSLYDSWSEEPWSAVHAARFHVLLLNATAEGLEVTAVPTDGKGPLDTFRILATPLAAAPAAGAEEAPAAVPGVAPLAALVLLGAVAALRGRRT